MSFSTKFARALAPVAILAIAAPAAAKELPDMARLSAHITSVQTMTANFVQTDARGRSAAGTLQMKRPGKIRFQYGSGDLLLVADGRNLNMMDYQVGQKSSWPLNRTPLGVLLSGSPEPQGPRPDRARARTRGSSPSAPAIPRNMARSTLVFMRSASAPGGLQMYGWTAIDAQNRRTTVKLSERPLQRRGAGKRVHLRPAEEAVRLKKFHFATCSSHCQAAAS